MVSGRGRDGLEEEGPGVPLVQAGQGIDRPLGPLLGEPDVAFVRDAPGPDAADGFAVEHHPQAEVAEDVLVGRGDPPVGAGPDVEEHVAAAGPDVDEVLDDLGRRPDDRAGQVRPLIARGQAALPGPVVGLPGDLLLGGRDLAAADEDVLADAPGVLLERLALAVEPEHEDVAVAGQELLDVAALVVEEAELLRAERGQAVEAGLVDVAGPLARLPLVAEIARRIVESDEEAFLAEGLGDHGRDVPAVGRPGDLEIAEGRVEHAEAVVVLGREDDVFHAGELGQAGPFAGIERGRVEGRGQGVILPDEVVRGVEERPGDLRPHLGVRAPVDEQAEAGVAEDLGLGRIVGQADGVFGEKRDRRLLRRGRRGGAPCRSSRPDPATTAATSAARTDPADTRGHRERHGGLLRPSLLMEREEKSNRGPALTSPEGRL